MKVLILSVTAGNGHNACAKGMKDKLEQMGAEVKVLDMLKEFSTALNYWTADKGYNIVCSRFLPAYNAFYNLYKSSSPEKRFKSIVQGIPLSTLKGLYKEINSYRPDVIYCTHFYGAIALTDLKLYYKMPCKTIVSNLDYVNSPFWEAGIGVDYFAIPHEDFIDECISEGYKKEQLIATGIPVNEKFYKDYDKFKTRKLLGLDENIYTVMIMLGGGHFASAVKIFNWIVKGFKKDVQVIVINGRNEKAYEKIEKMKESLPNNIKLCNVGFTNKVELYMAASDVIIDKLGGTSATQIINRKLPFIVIDELPAQEEHNLCYLEKKGMTKSFVNRKELVALLEDYMDKNLRDKIVDKLAGFRKNSIKELAEFIMSQPKAEYDEEYIRNIEYSKINSNVRKAMRNAHREYNVKAKIKNTKPKTTKQSKSKNKEKSSKGVKL